MVVDGADPVGGTNWRGSSQILQEEGLDSEIGDRAGNWVPQVEQMGRSRRSVFGFCFGILMAVLKLDER